jgi:transcriptional regulator with GAF, ATPase, and Fis domain
VGLDVEYEPVLEFLRSIKNESFTMAEQLILNWAAALQGTTSAPTSLDSREFSEREFLDGFGKAAFFRVFYDSIKLHLHLVHGDFDEAVESAESAALVAHSVSGTIWQMLLRFYRSMAIVARRGPDRPTSESEAAQLAEDLAMLKLWADNCAENFGHAYLLVKAELARIGGAVTDAEDCYRRAIDAAQVRGFPGDLALANERYGRFWHARGQTRIATMFLLEALRIYDDWGARPKAEMLARELSAMLRSPAHEVSDPDRSLSSPAAVLATLQSPSEALDFEWAMQAAGALASEIELDRLLETLMRTLLESAGAERGGLVLEKGDEPFLRVWGDADRGEIALLDLPLEESDAVPHTVLRYVRRTREHLVLDDAIEDPAYASDPYVQSRRPHSILCLPILYQSRFVGAVYLENSLHTGAFSRASLHLLETLSVHAAIAIRNAELFDEVARLEERLRAENVYLQEEIRTHRGFEDIIGESPRLEKVLDQVQQVADVDTTVLILGETGTGKELLARAIHRLSPRSAGPLVTVNCGAISPGLIESELFGHEKGAFTGATERKIGRFELADKGTILLDEIGDLSLELQVKLLRVLQEGEIQRVGGNRTIHVDVRIIASTHRDLEKAQKEGRFRPDLFYRLNVFPIRNPPLRERREDIPALAQYFLMKDGARLGRQITSIPRRTMAALQSYDWPGNVRELRNVLERSIITSRGSALELGNWLPSETEDPDTTPTRTLDEVQRDYIERVLQTTGWVVSGPNGAAVRLGLKPTTLEARMKKLGLRRPT